MKNMKLYLTGLCFLAIASSCTKVIDIKTGDESGKLDIEANIVDAAGPQIIRISKNVPFTNTNTYPPVTGASVIVADAAGNSFLFTEGPSGTYANLLLTGLPGKAYKLTVVTGGTTYNATSIIPVKVALDSITSENEPTSSGSKPKKQIVVHYQDPGGVANYYRFVMFVNGIQVKSVFAFDDDFNDGRYVNNILREDDIDIYAGDKITVEMQCVDHPIYLYWFTLSQQLDSGPGGSVTPSDPPTNITPVSLGYFSAHTTQTRTLTVK